MKKSTGLKAKVIENGKFNVSLFNGELKQSFLKILPKIGKSLQKATRDYRKELRKPVDEKEVATLGFWNEIREKAEKLGIELIGFAVIDENLIFKTDLTTKIDSLYENAIVLGMEMNYDAIETAPKAPAGLEALNIYAELGVATNDFADFIRSKGFGAIACHPLGGPILYPAMAVKANMGEIGKQGILITKKFGPRQRLSMIATNASPLPEVIIEDYKVSEYCEKCGRCIKMCPANAILEVPIVHENGTISRIDAEKCFNYFYENVGCSICIKVCPFHKVGYEKLFKLKFYS